MILTSVVTRHFEPDFYKKEGFMKPITISHDLSFPTLGSTLILENTVSKSEISFYDNYYFDTSAFTFRNLAQKFENYQIESQNRRTSQLKSLTDYNLLLAMDFT